MKTNGYIEPEEAADILRLLGGGHDEKNRATEILFKKLSTKVLKRLLFFGCGETLANDLRQEIFVRIYTTNSLPAEPAALVQWLMTITKNIFLDNCRKSDFTHEKETVSFDPTIHDNKAFEPPGDNDIDKCLTHALYLLGKKSPEKSIALNMVLKDVGIKDISQVLQRTEQATRQFLYEARKSLKDYAEPCWQLLKHHGN